MSINWTFELQCHAQQTIISNTISLCITAVMSLESIPVSSFMTRTVKIETEDQNIQAVCKIMNENNIGSIVVVTLRDKAQNPVGIITERDIVRTVGQLNPSLLHVPIRELMSKPLITLSPNSTYQRCITNHAAKGY